MFTKKINLRFPGSVRTVSDNFIPGYWNLCPDAACNVLPEDNCPYNLYTNDLTSSLDFKASKFALFDNLVESCGGNCVETISLESLMVENDEQIIIKFKFNTNTIKIGIFPVWISVLSSGTNVTITSLSHEEDHAWM